MKIRLLLIAGVALATVSSSAYANGLEGAIPILDGGKPLDVEHSGHAAPCVADFDGDGNKDLLVGEFYQGRLRIYRNIGTNRQPQFDGFTVFREGAPVGRVNASCCMGFGPQLVDLNGDGNRDLISGDWLGRIILFKGTSAGGFLSGSPLLDAEDRPIHVDYGVYAFAHDWDSDGDYDLFAGTVGDTTGGAVYFLANHGSRTTQRFAPPAKVLAGGEELVAPGGCAAPVIADWDGDNKPDLILGCGDGSVRWCRSTGSPASLQLSEPQIILPAPQENSRRGVRSKISVTDWNEDGRLDLLVGDFGKSFPKRLTEEEQLWREAARTRQNELFSSWSGTFQEYRDLLRRLETGDGDNTKELEHRLGETRQRLVTLKSLRVRYHREEQALQPGLQYHGHVWLYLGRPSEALSEPTERDASPQRPAVPAAPTDMKPVVVAAKTATNGSDVTLTVRMRIAAGWHVYAPDTKKGRPTKLRLQLPDDLAVDGKWELPTSETNASADGGLIYRGEQTFRRRLKLAPNATPGEAIIQCMLTYQACSELICLPPRTVKFSSSVAVTREED